jgi:hypothetical protein
MRQEMLESGALSPELSAHLENCPECRLFSRDVERIRTAVLPGSLESTPDWLHRQTLTACLDGMAQEKLDKFSRIKAYWHSSRLVLVLTLAFAVLLAIGLLTACSGQSDAEIRRLCMTVILFILLQNILMSLFLPLFVCNPGHRTILTTADMRNR